MLQLFPQGFEEVAQPDGVELVAYTDPGGEERLWAAFGGIGNATDVASDWEEGWRTFHRPVRIGPLWVGQPWQEPPADATPVVIEPGRAFGTGAHATTRLCLELLTRIERGSLLDVGCGSGVVAIAAAMLGFGPIHAVDVDEHAVAATRANAAANGVGVEVRRADVLVDDLPETDVVVANVTLGVVRALGRRLRCRTLVTSGYLVTDDVRIPGFDHLDRAGTEGWAADLHARAH
jgi:ribosomal protein L11 methyltransferase